MHLNSHLGQLTARDGSRGLLGGGGFSQHARKQQLQVQVHNVKVKAPHSGGGSMAAPPPKRVNGSGEPLTIQPPPMARSSPPPAVSPLPPVASSLHLSMDDNTSSADGFSQEHWSSSQETSTPNDTPIPSCTPDEQASFHQPRVPPPKPSPKSHRHRGSRFTGTQSESDEDEEEEELALVHDEAVAAAAASGSGAAGEDIAGGGGLRQDMDGVAETGAMEQTTEDGAEEDASSPAFQINTIKMSGNPPPLPSSTPTPDVERRRHGGDVTAPPVAMMESEPMLSSSLDDPLVARQPIPQRRDTRKVNANPFSQQPPKRRSSSKNVAGHTTDQCSDYDWLEPLGNGSFGEVSKVRKRIDGWVYAMKRSKRLVTASEQKEGLREVSGSTQQRALSLGRCSPRLLRLALRARVPAYVPTPSFAAAAGVCAGGDPVAVHRAILPQLF
jgi:hypothetical protein